MATCEMVRQLALALPGTEERDHFGRPSFRAGGRIFATLWPQQKRAVLRLAPDHQTMLFEAGPETFSPARWGKLVWTFVELPKVNKQQLAALLTEARQLVEPPGPRRRVSAKRVKK